MSSLDQFCLLITNVVSDFAGDEYFYVILLVKDHILLSNTKKQFLKDLERCSYAVSL